MDISEFILKMFTVGIFIAGILGMILQSINFQGQISSNDNMRLAIDMANAAAAAPCLAQTIGNDVRKGVIDYGKLEDAKKNFCLAAAKPFKITIRNSSAEIFSVGTLQQTGVKIAQPLPVLIKNGEEYSNGVLDVEIGS